MSEKKLFPVIKWAGGKTQLLDKIIENMPIQYNRYFEPFVGGGAVLFGIMPYQGIINDINAQLVNVYLQIKENVSEIIKKINIIDSMSCNKNLYNYVRYKYNNKICKHILDVESAAFMIWINKHCFNGLYRVNKQGFFNVPYNKKVNGKSIDENNLKYISKYLKNSNITITCLDFERACNDVEKGDFVYFDSPYVPESVTASFTNYTANGFSFIDHKRLTNLFYKLDKIGAKIMLSNNDVPLIHELYSDYHIQSFTVKRMINRDGNKRTGREVIVTNY